MEKDYVNAFKALAKLTPTDKKVLNVLLTHTPIYGVIPDGKDEKSMLFIGYNANMRKALYDVPDYKPQVLFSGHVHLYQRLQSASATQFIIGNSGTKMVVSQAVPELQGRGYDRV